MKEACENCKHFYRSMDEMEYTYCTRYPEWVRKEEDHRGCGEFQTKESDGISTYGIMVLEQKVEEIRDYLMHLFNIEWDEDKAEKLETFLFSTFSGYIK